MEETLSSSYPKPLERRVGLGLCVGLSLLLAVGALVSVQSGEVGFALLLLLFIGGLVLIAREQRATFDRVTLRDDDVLRLHRGRHVRDIPLRRVRSVEHDLPGRGPRRVMLLIEPTPGVGRSLERVEFVPRGGTMGLGGRAIADELRRRAQAARATHAAT